VTTSPVTMSPTWLLPNMWSDRALGTVLGALIGWRITRIEGRETARHAQQADATLTTLARALEAGGVIEFNRDPNGRIIGIVHHLSATGNAVSSGSATLTVEPGLQDGEPDSPTKRSRP
jgi:hypothetical protein